MLGQYKIIEVYGMSPQFTETNVCVRVCACVRACVCVCVIVHLNICIINQFLGIRGCTWMGVSVCLYVWVCTCIHVS